MKKYIFCFTFLLVTLFVSSAQPEADKTPGKERQVLTLKDALILGIQNNLDIKISQVDLPVSEAAVVINESVFDPRLDAFIFSSEEETPIALVTLLSDDIETEQSGVIAGISKKSKFGLTSRFSMETYRIEDNTPSYILSPEYRNFLILELNQPLLRDVGIKINTTNLNVARNQKKQAELGYLSRVNQIVRTIETTYYELAKAVRTLEFTIESRDLAKTLLAGNRKKFKAGVVPVSEVQRAETAVASRD